MIRASGKGWGRALLEAASLLTPDAVTQQQHEQRALAQGKIAVYSMLRDWIKGQITAVETGLLSFEVAFLGQIMLPSGETVLERVTHTEMLALPKPN